jgi:hypothetical protein
VAKKACALAFVDYELFNFHWMKRPGEPFETIRQLVKLAEGQFEERHARNLNVAAMKKPLSPELSGWMLTHAPSTKKGVRKNIRHR